MGGDHAPLNVVTGSLEALREVSNRFEIVFVGPESVIDSTLQATPGCANLAYTLVHASQVVQMEDGATSALKQKKDSSIVVGMTLLKDREVDAFVSAGHTGAMMSASTLILGRIPGVGRPTIGAFLPSQSGKCLLLDAGANVDCKPQHLYEFAVMGSIYTREMFGIERPAVGLLSIGEEETKGSDVVKEANQLLKKSDLNFIGNVEGRDILGGKAHVVVCDGFVGNVLLKFGESIPGFFKAAVKKYSRENLYRTLVAMIMRSPMRAVFRGMDYEEEGGVPVLGVNGVSIIGHGKSSPKAVKNMILRAEEMVGKNISLRIQEALSSA